MKIYKDTFSGFESQTVIEAEIQKAAQEWQDRCEGNNNPFMAQPWAVELVKTGENFEFINMTLAEEKQQAAEEAQIETDVALENEKLEAQTTPSPRYAEFRKVEYPDPMELNDAKVKQASPDPAIQAEGVAQEQQYYTDCLAIKAKYLKFVE